MATGQWQWQWMPFRPPLLPVDKSDFQLSLEVDINIFIPTLILWIYFNCSTSALEKYAQGRPLLQRCGIIKSMLLEGRAGSITMVMVFVRSFVFCVWSLTHDSSPVGFIVDGQTLKEGNQSPDLRFVGAKRKHCYLLCVATIHPLSRWLGPILVHVLNRVDPH